MAALGRHLRWQVVEPALVHDLRHVEALQRKQLRRGWLTRYLHRLHVLLAALHQVAILAGRDDVGPVRLAASLSRDDVIERQRRIVSAAVLALEAIPQEHVRTCERDTLVDRNVIAHRDDSREPHLNRRTADDLVVLCDDTHRALPDVLDRLLPRLRGQREKIQRPEVGVEHETWIG